MIQKWKCILTNWVNCYFTESDKKDLSIKLDTLINIISHLRENFNLDGSTSSVLEAHTIPEFITEKYPHFKFQNGTSEPSTDNDLYLAASLLLFSVCVNSKDVDLKSAMCKTLSTQDQEIILKFTKNILELSTITHKDVYSAIQEACGQDIAAAEPAHHTVAETPPALRSLHGEVRRLQAALDAERFDRNFLQDELSRSNMKLEKLLKDKEQYKLEILNLKAKISFTSEQSDETNSQSSENNSSKLLKQVQTLEEELEKTQDQVDELQFERDSLKSKIEELKQERDKWLLLGQESVTRVDKLLEELESEKRQVQSYKELVAELRTHNQRNFLDTSQLECDDPNASIHSLPHNASVCSEACANVVEVQLLEERAKIVDLQQQLQTLQQQVDELTQKANADKLHYEELINEKDENILNMKHKINEEIEEKNLLTNNLNDEITKLNNEMNELEQKFKDHKESARQALEKKTEEIQILQEEKMSLLQSLSDETSKLEQQVKDLQNTLEIERSSKKQMREEYDSQIMHLNEKVLNRNNELVELQNNVFDKSEMIESMRVALEMRETHLRSLMEQLSNYEEEINELRKKLTDEQNCKSKMREDYENKLMKVNEKIGNRNNELVELQNNVFEKSEKIESMRIAMEDKVKILNELTNTNKEMEKKVNVLEQQYESDKHAKEKTINELECKIDSLSQEIINKNTVIENHLVEHSKIMDEIKQLQDTLEKECDDKLKRVASFEITVASLNEQAANKDHEILNLKTELTNKTDYIHSLESEKTIQSNLCIDLEKEVSRFIKQLTIQDEEHVQQQKIIDSEKEIYSSAVEKYKSSVKKLQVHIETLKSAMFEKNSAIENFIRECADLKSELDQIKSNMDDEKNEKVKLISEFELKVENLSKQLSDKNQDYDNVSLEVKNKADIIEKLNKEILDLQYTVKEMTDKAHKLDIKNTQLSQKIKKSKALVASEKKLNDNRINDMVKTIQVLENEVKELQKNCSEKVDTIKIMGQELDGKKTLLKELNHKTNELENTVKELQENIIKVQNSEKTSKETYEASITELNEKVSEYESELSVLKNMVTVTESIMSDQKEASQVAQKEMEKLRQQYTNTVAAYEEEKTTLETEKDQIAKQLEATLASEAKLLAEKNILNEEINIKTSEIQNLLSQHENVKSEVVNLQETITRATEENTHLRDINKNLKESFDEGKKDLIESYEKQEESLTEKILLLQTEINNKTLKIETLETQIENADFVFKNKIESLQDYFNKETQTLINKLVDLENVKEKLESTLNYQHIELKNLRIELEEREIEIKRINDENYSLNCVIKEKQDGVSRLTYERESLLEIKSILENEKSQLLEESKILRDQMETEKQETNSKVQELQKEKETIENKISSAEIDKENLEKQIELMNRNLIETRKEMDIKDYQLETFKVQIKNLEEMFTKQTLVNENLQTESEEKIQNAIKEYKLLQENHESDVKILEKTISELKVELEQRDLQLTSLRDQIQVLNQGLENESIDKENRTTCLKAEIEKLQNSNAKLQEKIDEHESNITSLRNNIQELESCNKTLQEEKEKYTLMISELNNDIEKKLHLTSVVEESQKTIENLEEKLLEYEKQSEQSLKTIQELVANCSHLEQTHNETVQELNNFKAEINKLEETVKIKNDAINSLYLELQKAKEHADVTINCINKEQNSLAENLNKEIEARLTLQQENEKVVTEIKKKHENERKEIEKQVYEKEESCNKLVDELNTKTKEICDLQALVQDLKQQSSVLQEEVSDKANTIQNITEENERKDKTIAVLNSDITELQSNNNELKIKKDTLEIELAEKIGELNKELHEKNNITTNTQSILQEHKRTIKELEDKLINVCDEKLKIEQDRDNTVVMLKSAEKKICDLNEIILQLEQEKTNYAATIEENKTVITNLEQLIKHELEQNQHLREESGKEKLDLTMKCTELQGHRTKMEKDLDDRQKEVQQLTDVLVKNNEELTALRNKVNKLSKEMETSKQEIKTKDALILKLTKDKDAVIGAMSKELLEEKETKDKYQKELETKAAVVYELRQKIEGLTNDEVLKDLRKDNDELIKTIGHRETVAVGTLEKSPSRKSTQSEKFARMFFQVDNTPPTDHSHTSSDSHKTITDLEKILDDKNRIITTLQSDNTYMKSLLADSENKLMDVTRELDLTKENCDQLSSQLKKIVNLKNDEIAELKKQVIKMSATENRASQIIKLSAKYQSIILMRIAEIKSNTVLKELTNFGNTGNSENELRRGIQAGTVTMDDLENFLDTTDRHIKRCADKITTLQKERDRLYEVSRINESEIISMKKFLTELSVSYKTFNTVKDVYMQKLSRVVSMQRTVRREILALDGHITDVAMCKLERGYAAVIQDLAETALNIERWVERCLGRTISPEKIKQAFSTELDRVSLAPSIYQNAGLEVQIEELEKSFQKLLEEVSAASRGEGARDQQSVTVMEVRAEYEDKLNRMKTKMKQLYQEQISVYKEKQKEEIAQLQRDLQRAKDMLAESSRAYEEHIKGLTSELWSFGEKLLVQKEEADWLRRKRSGSLMSLQHVHSSGLIPASQEPSMPNVDSASLRSLPVSGSTATFEKRERDLTSTPRAPDNRLSELRWRNSLCPPHLRSLYPAETQFARGLDEDDIKCTGRESLVSRESIGGRGLRKEVGITAYKKPGPPTPSKQAGRLSATDGELRDSLRVSADPGVSRKQSSPSRLLALFRSRDNSEMTPRKRLSNIFRKK